MWKLLEDKDTVIHKVGHLNFWIVGVNFTECVTLGPLHLPCSNHTPVGLGAEDDDLLGARWTSALKLVETFPSLYLRPSSGLVHCFFALSIRGLTHSVWGS